MTVSPWSGRHRQIAISSASTTSRAYGGRRAAKKGEVLMSKYLFEVNYTLDGVKGLRSEGGSARVAAATELIEGLGGKVESFHFAFGGTDVYVVADFPDNVSAAAASLTVSAGGGAMGRIVVLLTAAELDAAAAKTTTYRPPGG